MPQVEKYGAPRLGQVVTLNVGFMDRLPITWAIQENEKHGIEHRDFNIQLNQSGQAVNGFSKVHGFGVEIDFFDFCVGTHHEVLAPERDPEQSIGVQVVTLSVVFRERYLVLERLPHSQSVADYEVLLPWNCSPKMPRQAKTPTCDR